MLKRIKTLIWNFTVNILGSSMFVPKGIRRRIYKICGIQVGIADINPRCFIRTSNLIIGHKTFINNACFIENNAKVTIGDSCNIAMDVLIGSDTHEIGKKEKRAGKTASLPISIGNGTWIGARATILAGVTIGEGCIIAAGSVVTKDCEPNGVYAGVPATRKKDLPVD